MSNARRRAILSAADSSISRQVGSERVLYPDKRPLRTRCRPGSGRYGRRRCLALLPAQYRSFAPQGCTTIQEARLTWKTADGPLLQIDGKEAPQCPPKTF